MAVRKASIVLRIIVKLTSPAQALLVRLVVMARLDRLFNRLRWKVRSRRIRTSNYLRLTGDPHSVKWVGLFVTLLVGAYTIEDLWDKFGDLRMPVVRVSLSLSNVLSNAHLRTADLHQALARKRTLPHRLADVGLHGVLQAALYDPQPIWIRRFANELSLPGELGRERLPQQPIR